jgi:DNA-binding transcriptional MerR regulator
MYTNENENQFGTDFSGIPALDDTQGLTDFLNNEALAAQGLNSANTEPQEPAQKTEVSTQPTQPAAPQFTKEQLAELSSKVDALNKQLSTTRAASQAAPVRQGNSGYTPQEQTFITTALQRGYSLEQINQVIAQHRAQSGVTPNKANAIEQRIAAVEQFLQTQQYQQAEAAFINKATSFGNKWGLTDADIEVFATEALKHGINIAMENVDLDMVFRAVYPEQYAIRSQRMTPTNASQIYGGNSIPEGNRAQASRTEDAYVEAFLRSAMPNQYGMLNKK